jgi:hypothetical protein
MNKLLQKVYGNTTKDFCFDVFEPFMLTEKRMMDAIMRSDKIPKTNDKTHDKTNPKTNNKKTNEYFVPHEKDTLFWCFFIMKYGMDMYTDLGKINIVIEKKWKIDYIELLRKNNKKYKIAPLHHVENFLLNEPKIDIKTFLVLCLLENLQILYIHKNTWHEIGNEEDVESSFILKRHDNPLKYGFKNNSNEISDIKEKCYNVKNLAKPLKAMSSYKLDELIDICKKLGINVVSEKNKSLVSSKSKGKKELYEELVKYFS